MGKIKCPECGHSFDLTASDYESVVSQVRNAEFEKELQSHMKTLESTYEDKLELQLQKARMDAASVVQLEQIFTIDKSRIQRFLGQTTRHEMRRIEEALMNSLEINEWDRRNADE